MYVCRAHIVMSSALSGSPSITHPLKSSLTLFSLFEQKTSVCTHILYAHVCRYVNLYVSYYALTE